jgi:predicted Zn-dependent protease
MVRDEGELAGALAHAIGHVAWGHGSRKGVDGVPVVFPGG